MPRGAPTVRGTSPAFTNSKHHCRAESSLHTESVSGVSAVSAVSAALLISTVPATQSMTVAPSAALLTSTLPVVTLYLVADLADDLDGAVRSVQTRDELLVILQSGNAVGDEPREPARIRQLSV